MKINLNKVETESLKAFFMDNMEWMKLRDFTKETDLIELVNRYGKFLEENKLELNKSLSRLLIDLKDNLTRIRISPPNLKQRSLRNINNPDRDSNGISLLEVKEMLYQEMPPRNGDNLSKDELDTITEMLAARIMEREQELKSVDKIDNQQKEGYQKVIK